jgi:hypothetical protein
MAVVMTMSERLEVSDWTPAKQTRFARFISGYTNIAAAMQRKYEWPPWLYVDLTAGSGRLNHGDSIIEGSPLLALRAFANHPTFQVCCLLIERHAGRYAELHEAVSTLRQSWPEDVQQRIAIACGCTDNTVFLRRLDARFPSFNSASNGLLYWDGLGQDACPIVELNSWMYAHRKHDLLVMASGCAPKRAGLGRARLDGILKRTIRPNLWIAKPETAWQWTFALMSEWPPLGNKLSNGHMRFACCSSPEGKAFLDVIGTTNGERHERENPALF